MISGCALGVGDTPCPARLQLEAEIERLRAAIEAAKDVVREHDRVGSTSTSRRATIITLREALYRLEHLEQAKFRVE